MVKNEGIWILIWIHAVLILYEIFAQIIFEGWFWYQYVLEGVATTPQDTD